MQVLSLLMTIGLFVALHLVMLEFVTRDDDGNRNGNGRS